MYEGSLRVFFFFFLPQPCRQRMYPTTEFASNLPIEIIAVGHGWEYSTMVKRAGVGWPQLRAESPPLCLPTVNTAMTSYLPSFPKPQLRQLWSGAIEITLQHILCSHGQLSKLLGWSLLPFVWSLWNCASEPRGFIQGAVNSPQGRALSGWLLL